MNDFTTVRDYKTRIASNRFDFKQVKRFLASLDLDFEDNIEYTMMLWESLSDEMVGTGSISGNVLKCIGISRKYQGEGLSSTILTDLIDEAHRRGRKHLLIFTKPGKKGVFESRGFDTIIATDSIALLELTFNPISKFLTKLKTIRNTDRSNPSEDEEIAGIIINSDPFTNGHLQLIETAAKESDWVYIFVILNPDALFSTETRLRLSHEATAHIPNVTVIEGSSYIVPQNIFPSYFLQKYSDISFEQAKLNATLFGRLIAPSLGITTRWIGNDPSCKDINSYISAIRSVLQPLKIKTKLVPLKNHNEEIITRSRVVDVFSKQNTEELDSLVPPSVFSFLTSSNPEVVKAVNQLKK